MLQKLRKSKAKRTTQLFNSLVCSVLIMSLCNYFSLGFLVCGINPFNFLSPALTKHWLYMYLQEPHRSNSLITWVSQHRAVKNGHGSVHQMRVEEEKDPPQSIVLYQSPPAFPVQ